MWLTPFLCSILALGAATPLHELWDAITVKHSWSDAPRGWLYDSTPPADHTFDLHIGLTQSRIDDLLYNLMEVSEPTHSRYGQHLTKEEAEDLVSSTPGNADTVKNWLTFHGVDPSRITHRKAGGDWLVVRATVAEAERLLNTKYHVYHHEPSGERIIRTLSYSLPHILNQHVDMIAPTTYFGTLRTMRRTSFLQPEIVGPLDGVDTLADPTIDPILADIPPGCKLKITPACLRALYNSTNYIPKSSSRNQLGVAGYLGQYANDVDLQTFLARYRSDAKGFTVPTVRVSGGGNDQNNPGVEANLDVQYTSAISYPTPNIYYSTGGSPPFTPDSATTANSNEPYLEWLTYMLSQPIIPQVITTSYGDDEQTVPEEYARRVCQMFAQMGARGTTLFFSSGDSGVGAGDCKTNDGTDRVLFQPMFPASCPFITTVGGTTSINPEVGVSFSGGGFSRYFARPDYQTGAVSEFLGNLGAQYGDLYNRTGRAYPDISAQANRFQVVVGGLVVSVAGTSASAPTVAGIFALLNDYRLSKGLPSLGFINPVIYSAKGISAFNDIISGSNPGCGTNGFTATRGWDPVTGLGTPDFPKLQALFSS